MTEPSDEYLVERSRQGDARAFVTLLHRYEQPLADLIRYRIDRREEAEDVLQETLIAAWMALGQLRQPDRVRAWLLQVARNRCRDFLRSAHRCEIATEARELEAYIHRSGFALTRQAQSAAEALEVLGEIAPAQQEIVRLFYLEGLTIAEIAQRAHCPVGTVKRRLFHARERLRHVLEETRQERIVPMTTPTRSPLHSLPDLRPGITITVLDQEPFAVDCPELRWWFIIPRIGEQAAWAAYEPLEGKITSAAELRVMGPARVHGVEGVEIQVTDWAPTTGWSSSVWRIYGRLAEEKAQYLAVLLRDQEKTLLQTFLDEGFAWNWGEQARRLEDLGHVRREEDGALTLAPERLELAHTMEAIGAGVFYVRIGAREYTCLRALQLEGALTDVHAPITEGFITREGRTVLVRHYCNAGLQKVAEFPVRVDESTRLIINGVPFFHWYDSVSHRAT